MSFRGLRSPRTYQGLCPWTPPENFRPPDLLCHPTSKSWLGHWCVGRAFRLRQQSFAFTLHTGLTNRCYRSRKHQDWLGITVLVDGYGDARRPRGRVRRLPRHRHGCSICNLVSAQMLRLWTIFQSSATVACSRKLDNRHRGTHLGLQYVDGYSRGVRLNCSQQSVHERTSI